MAISKRNQRGIWVLILGCVLFAYVPRVVASWKHEPIKLSVESIDQAEHKVVQKQKVASEKKQREYQKRQKRYQVPPSKFDPNEYLKEDWMQLGLSEKQAAVVMKFTARGVTSDEELRKIFVIPEEVFSLIEDSTYYSSTEREQEQLKPVQSNKLVDLNSASAEELKSLPGIGDFYAKKIIEERESLGGYVNSQQLLELWKFGDERYQRIRERISVEGGVEKININTADIETLKSHPYISYKVANSIVKMRAAHGEYNSIEEIKRSVLIDDDIYQKIEPYLTL